jgi:hypothetical protein
VVQTTEQTEGHESIETQQADGTGIMSPDTMREESSHQQAQPPDKGVTEACLDTRGATNTQNRETLRDADRLQRVRGSMTSSRNGWQPMSRGLASRARR